MDTTGLVLVDGCARIAWAEDYPWGLPTERTPDDLVHLRAAWGRGGGTMMFLAPNLLADRALATSFIRYERQSASPGMAAAMIGWLYDVDVRDVLPSIGVPTLLLSHVGSRRSTAGTARNGSRAHGSSSCRGRTTTRGRATPRRCCARSRSS